MKKLLLAIALGASFVFGTSKVMAQAESTAYGSYSLLNGWHVVITNNSTVNWGATNIAYADAGNTNLEYSLTNTYYTAYFNNGTQYWTNTILTNANIPAFNLAWKDVPTWADRNGNIPSDVSLQIVITGDDANATNLVTFTFCKLAYSGLNFGQGNQPRANLVYPAQGYSLFSAETVAGNQFVVTMNGNGATPVVLVTNLPSTFFGGAGAIRLLKVQTSNSYTNTYLNTVALTGFAP